MIKQPWKFIGFVWALPMTLIGLAWALILGAKWMRLEHDDWSLHFICPDDKHGQKWLLHFNVGAQTLGNMIVYSRSEYAGPETTMVKHERVHVKQGMKFGIFNLFLYLLLSVLAWMYGQDIYRGNEAEEQARYESGEVSEPDDIKPKDHTGGKL